MHAFPLDREALKMLRTARRVQRLKVSMIAKEIFRENKANGDSAEYKKLEAKLTEELNFQKQLDDMIRNKHARCSHTWMKGLNRG